MERVFRIGMGFNVPDGTMVYPFLNPMDRNSNLPSDVVDAFSIAAGDIEPGVSSKIHVHPVVTQVTFVISGRLTIWMKDVDHVSPYALEVVEQEAVLTRPGTFFQLVNETRDRARVLYIVSPPYLFVPAVEGEAAYDDAVVLDHDWARVEALEWKPPEVPDKYAAKAARDAFASRHSRALVGQ